MNSKDHSKVKSSIDWNRDEPLIKFPLAVGNQHEMPPHILGQHTLITGTTGSGKSQSVVLPIAHGLLSYHLPGCEPTGGLVIDPKNELLRELSLNPKIKDRVLVLGKKNERSSFEKSTTELRLNLFEFSPQSSLLERVEQLKELSSVALNGDIDKWHAMAWEFATQLLNIQYTLESTSRNRADFLGGLCFVLTKQIAPDVELTTMLILNVSADEIVEKCGEKYRVSESTGTFASVRKLSENYEKSTAEKILNGYCNLAKLKQFMTCIAGSRQNLMFASEVINNLHNALALDLEVQNPFDAYSLTDDAAVQTCYYNQSMGPQLSLLTNNNLTEFLDLDPIKDISAGRNCFSMAAALDRGDILFYQPGQLHASADRLLGSALRMNYVSYIQSRNDMLQPQAFVCDEWQRYVSTSPIFGDDIFLSFCRSYRVMTCLSTQSVQALEASLDLTSRSSASIVVDSILNNISNRFMLRSSDVRTQAIAKNVFPFEQNYKRPHVLEVRPLSTLQVGEYYYVTPVDKGRTQGILAKEESVRTVLTPAMAEIRVQSPKNGIR